MEIGSAREQTVHVQIDGGGRGVQARAVDAEHGPLFRRVAARRRRFERQRVARPYRHAHHHPIPRLHRTHRRSHTKRQPFALRYQQSNFSF